MRHFEPDVLVTVQCAIVDASLGLVRISSAGHLPPVMARTSEVGKVAAVIQDVLIGVPDEKPRHVSTIDFPPGAMLCLFTDGLVERRDRPIDEGIARLAAAVSTVDPEVGCACVMAAMADSSPHPDDVALLMIRRDPASGGDRDDPGIGGMA